MNKIVSLAGFAGLLALSSGCAMAASPVTGFVYNGSQAHQSATGNPLGAKRGESCSSSILGIVATGDASAQAAAAAGGITKVSLVDTEVSSILGVYAKYCTVVHGE
ncbi:hypothetical protein AKJ09_05727 [Labilithrix luteola]|uniref:TRL-like protein family n=1 Tax=Labilithrix luteola TaxID=1391654 RepID=A0A0K1PZW0_9BACT|nr:TRL-like family protein [Labilithrix luteola]AKU99063.1 hypothetical protein AKJ09_05727 [Labilithrix luteola]